MLEAERDPDGLRRYHRGENDVLVEQRNQNAGGQAKSLSREGYQSVA